MKLFCYYGFQYIVGNIDFKTTIKYSSTDSCDSRLWRVELFFTLGITLANFRSCALLAIEIG